MKTLYHSGTIILILVLGALLFAGSRRQKVQSREQSDSQHAIEQIEADHKSQVEALEQELNVLRGTVLMHSDALARSVEELEKEQATNDPLRAKVRTLLAERTGEQSEEDSVREKLSLERERGARTHAALQEAKDELVESENEIAELERTLRRLTEDKQDAKKEADDHLSKLKATQKKLSASQATIEKHQAKMDTLTAETTTLRTEIEALKRQLTALPAAQETIKTLKAEIESLRAATPQPAPPPAAEPKS